MADERDTLFKDGFLGWSLQSPNFACCLHPSCSLFAQLIVGVGVFSLPRSGLQRSAERARLMDSLLCFVSNRETILTAQPRVIFMTPRQLR